MRLEATIQVFPLCLWIAKLLLNLWFLSLFVGHLLQYHAVAEACGDDGARRIVGQRVYQ